MGLRAVRGGYASGKVAARSGGGRRKRPDCNIKKANRPIEQFRTNQPDLLERILKRLKHSALASTTHINAALPALIKDLQATKLRVYLTDAASVSWTRQQEAISLLRLEHRQSRTGNIARTRSKR